MESSYPISVRPIREWQEKDGDVLLDSIRLYISRIHIATADPSKDYPNAYDCRMMSGYEFIDAGDGISLEEIKSQIELGIKEFFARVSKPRRLVKVNANTITVTLSDRAAKYLADLQYGLDFDGEPADKSQCISHALEELAAFEELTDDQVTGFLYEKYPEQMKSKAKDYLKPLLTQQKQ